MGVHTDEVVLPVVEVVAPLAQVEVNDADGLDFFDFAVSLAQCDVLRDGFRRPVKQPLQVVDFAGVMYLDEDDVALAVLGFDFHTVELVVLVQ